MAKIDNNSLGNVASTRQTNSHLATTPKEDFKPVGNRPTRQDEESSQADTAAPRVLPPKLCVANLVGQPEWKCLEKNPLFNENDKHLSKPKYLCISAGRDETTTENTSRSIEVNRNFVGRPPGTLSSTSPQISGGGDTMAFAHLIHAAKNGTPIYEFITRGAFEQLQKLLEPREQPNDRNRSAKLNSSITGRLLLDYTTLQKEGAPLDIGDGFSILSASTEQRKDLNSENEFTATFTLKKGNETYTVNTVSRGNEKTGYDGKSISSDVLLSAHKGLEAARASMFTKNDPVTKKSAMMGQLLSGMGRGRSAALATLDEFVANLRTKRTRNRLLSTLTPEGRNQIISDILDDAREKIHPQFVSTQAQLDQLVIACEAKFKEEKEAQGREINAKKAKAVAANKDSAGAATNANTPTQSIGSKDQLVGTTNAIQDNRDSLLNGLINRIKKENKGKTVEKPKLEFDADRPHRTLVVGEKRLNYQNGSRCGLAAINDFFGICGGISSETNQLSEEVNGITAQKFFTYLKDSLFYQVQELKDKEIEIKNYVAAFAGSKFAGPNDSEQKAFTACATFLNRFGNEKNTNAKWEEYFENWTDITSVIQVTNAAIEHIKTKKDQNGNAITDWQDLKKVEQFDFPKFKECVENTARSVLSIDPFIEPDSGTPPSVTRFIIRTDNHFMAFRYYDNKWHSTAYLGDTAQQKTFTAEDILEALGNQSAQQIILDEEQAKTIIQISKQLQSSNNP